MTEPLVKITAEVHSRSIDREGNIYEDGVKIGWQPPCVEHERRPGATMCSRCHQEVGPLTPTRPGYYWYKSTAERNPVGGGGWVVVLVLDDRALGDGEIGLFAEFNGIALNISNLPGVWHGPLEPPTR